VLYQGFWWLKEKYSDEYGEGHKYDRSKSDMSEKYIYEIKLRSLSNVTPILRTVCDSLMLGLRMFIGKKWVIIIIIIFIIIIIIIITIIIITIIITFL